MTNASRIRYNLDGSDLDYTTEPTHVRVYREDCGDDWPWHVDAADEGGNYTESLNRYASLAEALTDGIRDLVADAGYGTTVTRDNQQTDVCYVGKWAPGHGHGLTCFVTPDGEGRFYYDGPNEAAAQHGPLPIVFADRIED